MDARRWLLILLACGATGPTSGRLVVYDCQDERTTFTRLDLTGPADCPDPVSDYEEEETRTIQLLEVDTNLPVTGFQCEASLSQEVTVCGFFDSISYGSKWTVVDRRIEITPRECRHAARDGKITLQGRTHDVQVGRPHASTYYTRGGVDISDGGCTSTNFVLEDGTSVSGGREETTIRVLIKRIRGVLDITRRTVTWKDGVDIVVPYKDEVVRDWAAGTIVWEAEPTDCKERVSQIYSGDATLRRVRGQGMTNAILMVRKPTGEDRRFIGMALRERTVLCDRRAYSTHVKGLMITLLFPGDPGLEVPFRPGVGDVERTSARAEMGFLHLQTSLRVFSRFDQIQADVCLVQRAVLANVLHDLAAGDGYALLDTFGRGHQVHVRGAVAYIAKCAAKDAVRADFPNCTREIPVRLPPAGGLPAGLSGNELEKLVPLKFVDPLTWVITEFPTITPCSSIMPISWRIAGKWFCAGPAAQQCPRPKQLNTTVSTYTDFDFTEGMGTGPYTPDQMEEHLRYVQAREAREPLTTQQANEAARNAGGLSSNTLGLSLSAAEVEALVDSIGHRLIPFFGIVGDWYTHLAGFFLALTGLAILVNIGLRAYALYKELGFGLWMLAAVSEAMFALIRMPVEIGREVARRVQEPDAYGDLVPNLARHEQRVRRRRLALAMRGRAGEGARMVPGGNPPGGDAEGGKGPDDRPSASLPPEDGGAAYEEIEDSARRGAGAEAAEDRCPYANVAGAAQGRRPGADEGQLYPTVGPPP